MGIAWNDSLSTGVAEIDAQHKDFIKLIQRLQILHEKDGSKEFILRILLEMAKYAEYHFVSEENLMMLFKYPLLTQHQEQHNMLLRSVKYKIEAFENGILSLEEVIAFLSDWLLSHTAKEDGKIGDYLGSREENPES